MRKIILVLATLLLALVSVLDTFVLRLAVSAFVVAIIALILVPWGDVPESSS